jgi:alpha-1,3-mannosyltransferase
MKIAMLVRQYYPSIGGMETHVASLARTLQQRGHKVDVFTLDHIFKRPGALPHEEKIDAIQVTRWPFLGFQRFFAPIGKPAALTGYDVVHVHGVDGMFEFAARLPRRPGQALVATTHGLFFHTRWMAPLKRAYFYAITARLCPRFDAIIANSTPDAEWVAPYHRKVVIIPNAVEPLARTMAEGASLLTVGRLAEHKRVPLLLEALAMAPLRKARLHVVGPEWGVSVEALRAYAARLGVQDRVTFHGKVSAAVLERIVADCACFVSASRYEGFGMAMIEAMGAGLLPAVQANASYRELIMAAQMGRATDFTHPLSAAEDVAKVMQSVTPAARRNAIAFAARYSWDAHTDCTLALYDQVLNRIPARATA